MTILLNDHSRQTSQAEQQLYDHLLACVRREPPEQVLERFRRLFIQGVGYSEAQITLAIEAIVNSKQAEYQFPFFFNRCCHILVNCWQTQPHQQNAIPELVALLNSATLGINTYSRTLRRLRQLVKLFVDSEQFLTLRRMAELMSQSTEMTSFGSDTVINNKKEVGSLIRRYPYLYQHYLLGENSSYEQQQTVREIQTQTQRRFELNLSQYVTYQVRRAQAARQESDPRTKRLIQPVKNPTLLSDRDLGIALKHFTAKVEAGCSYRDLAHRFIAHTQQVSSYQSFKDDFYQYLTSSINPTYGKGQFNNRLYSYLKNILPQNHSEKPTELLLVRTCSQMLNHLVVESAQRPNHFVFVDLITNLGATYTTGLLLKVVLFCQKVKPYLEKRLAILFNHYESFTRDGVPWLITSLENLNVALSIHFGRADVSCLKHLF